MAFRFHPDYYGHRQSAFNGTIEGGESASSIIQKIHRAPQQGNEMEASPTLPTALLFMYQWNTSQ